jgi:hypothetical protein
MDPGQCTLVCNPPYIRENTETSTKTMGWAYLMKCFESPSMMNRERIWGIAKQLEKLAVKMGF